MVLLAAAVCNRLGKAIISRQFVEMSRARIEGLLVAFPKLMSGGKQHTFVETESVRYVYQPLEKLYVLLITTKASNILEDLETLRLFARVIPEYCRNIEESEIIDQSFPLIFAFDEIIALGYRENVNIAQIRTFTEMDSHEERVFMAVRQTQEKEARDHMRKKAEELKKMRAKGGGRAPGFGGGFGSSSVSRMDSPIIDISSTEPVKPSYTNTSKPTGGPSKAMKLGSKTKDVDTFVDQLKLEGMNVISAKTAQSPITKLSTPTVNQESIHLKIEEKISLTAGRDGGLQNLELFGLMKLKISNEKSAQIRVGVVNNDTKGIQLQTHPNIDKKLFNATSYIGLKNADKPFPLNQDIGILKWRFQSQDENFMPLSINCWPSESGDGCGVNIEYELERMELELNEVIITIPLPSGVGAPVVGEYDGEYTYSRSPCQLVWNLPVIDASNKSGSLEFSIGGHPNDFFPITVSFVSTKSYCDIQLTDVLSVDGDQPMKFSSEVLFYVEKYEIV